MKRIVIVFLLLGICCDASSQTIQKPRVRPEPLPKPGPSDAVRPTGVILDRTSLYLFAGGAPATLKATVTPGGAADKSVTWSSSNPQVAAVDAVGKVTCAGPGTCTIRATTEEGGHRATCDVMVDIMNTVGSTPGNVANDGYLAHQGNWVYYANPHDGMKLYKAMLYGQNKTKLSDCKVFGINVIGAWIYYVNESKGDRLSKVRIDGTGDTVLNDKDVVQATVSVVDQRVYYCTGGEMYSIGVNGLNRTKLNDERNVNCMIPVNEWLYYGVKSEDSPEGVYRIRTDGTDQMRLTSGYTIRLVVDGEWVYSRGQYGLVHMKTDGRNRNLLIRDRIYGMTAQDNWLYYWTNDALRKRRSDGARDQVLVSIHHPDLWSVNLFLAGDWVYYFPLRAVKGDLIRDSLFKIRTDGMSHQPVK